VENGTTTGITRNEFRGEHQIGTLREDTLSTNRTTDSAPIGDAPSNIPAEEVPYDGLRTGRATDDTPPDITADAVLTGITIAEPLPDVTVNETLAGITARQIATDKRKSWKSHIATEAEARVASPDSQAVRKAVLERFAKACDSSIRQRLASMLFEPDSPFDSKVPRQFRLETLVLGSLLAATAVAIAFFNICACLGR
jgi:hypothetical protein